MKSKCRLQWPDYGASVSGKSCGSKIAVKRRLGDRAKIGVCIGPIQQRGSDLGKIFTIVQPITRGCGSGFIVKYHLADVAGFRRSEFIKTFIKSGLDLGITDGDGFGNGRGG